MREVCIVLVHCVPIQNLSDSESKAKRFGWQSKMLTKMSLQLRFNEALSGDTFRLMGNRAERGEVEIA